MADPHQCTYETKKIKENTAENVLKKKKKLDTKIE